MRNIKGLLFDKDGTLFDFRTTWGAWARVFFMDIAQQDKAMAQKMALGMGFDFTTGEYRRDSIVIAGTPDDIVEALIDVLPGWTAEELVVRINQIATDVPQMEAVPLVPLLTEFRRRGIKLGVATNDAVAPAMAHLKSAGVVELFDFIAGFDSGFGAKPETGMQQGFCQAMNLRPAEVVMVGDSLHDLISGRNAGMHTIAVLTGMAESDELSPYADIVLGDIGEIPAYLGLHQV